MATSSNRRTADTSAPIRTSNHILNDLAAAEQAVVDAQAEADRVAGLKPSVLRSDDDNIHAMHRSEIDRIDRLVERSKGRVVDLKVELVAVEGVEEAQAQADRRVAVEAMVAAVVGRSERDYTIPAATIASYMADWSEAERAAREMRIPTPSAILRRRKGEVTGGSTIKRQVYIDEQGQHTMQPHPIGADGMIDRNRIRPTTMIEETIPGRLQGTGELPDLGRSLNIPRVDAAGEHHRGSKLSINTWS